MDLRSRRESEAPIVHYVRIRKFKAKLDFIKRSSSSKLHLIARKTAIPSFAAILSTSSEWSKPLTNHGMKNMISQCFVGSSLSTGMARLLRFGRLSVADSITSPPSSKLLLFAKTQATRTSLSASRQSNFRSWLQTQNRHLTWFTLRVHWLVPLIRRLTARAGS